MQNDKVNNEINTILDEFYNGPEYTALNKIFKKKEENFVKYQIDINKIMTKFDKKLVDTPTKSFIKKYIAYYIFMTLGYFYSNTTEKYINNVIEFSKNQPSYQNKIQDFFTSESNANVIKFYNLIKKMTLLVNADKNKLSDLVKKSSLKDALATLNKYGKKYVEKNFKLINLNGKRKNQSHNMIKSLIISNLYIPTDKKIIYQALEQTNSEEGEFIYIDIVVPRKQYIDFNAIESILPEEDVEIGVADDIYDLLKEITQYKKTHVDDKLLELINNNLVTPVSEDFLLYHKNSTKYSKDLSTTSKDDVKIRHIVNKIDNASEYYSEATRSNPDTKQKIEKLFFPPMKDRKVILVNSTENRKIINKLNNFGQSVTRNNEHYNDLINYSKYPYINFKDISKSGFPLTLSTDKTVDVVRSTSINQHKNKLLQMRIGSQDQNLNVVGFMVNNKKTALQCLKTDDVKNVKTLKFNKQIDGIDVNKTKNDYYSTLNLIKEGIFNKSDQVGFWSFDVTKNTVDSHDYEQMATLSKSGRMKLIAAQLYDDLTNVIYKKIKQLLTKKKMSFDKFNYLMKAIDKQFFTFPRDSDMYNDLKSIISYESYIKTDGKYDKKDDELPGLYGNVIKLTTAPKATKPKYDTIDIKKAIIKKEETDLVTDIEKYEAICQHFVTWDKMSAIRKTFPNVFRDILFKFINKYVVENTNDQFICKSCGSQINLTNFVADGTFDADGRYVTFSMPMDIPLENIKEYENYKSTIKNIDKAIEKVASIAGLPYFIGKNTVVKTRRRGITKDVIDLILVHNKNLKYTYKKRNVGQYGINKMLTNLFVFELENSIFIYSSKDKDHYKPIKQNNILIYIIFLMLLELNNSQIMNMKGDKICNYYFYEKFGRNFFKGIKIRKNNKNDIVPILNYPTLCYSIYYMSCMATKYNMWSVTKATDTTSTTKKKKKRFDPNVQRIIINTLIDLINSVIEFYGKKQKHYMYDIVSVKFFERIQTILGKDDILMKLRKIEFDKISKKNDKKVIVQQQEISFNLDEPFKPGKYHGRDKYIRCVINTKNYQQRKNIFDYYENITNVTNCESGEFHNWVIKDGVFQCTICKVSADTLKYDATKSKNATKNYKYITLKKLANQYCISGKMHLLEYNTKTQCTICTKCKATNLDNLSKEDTKIFLKNLTGLQQVRNKKKQTNQDKKINRMEAIQKYDSVTIAKLKSEYGKTKSHKEDYLGFIDKFATSLEQIIGKNININNQNIYVKRNVYIIDHDHNGYTIKKPLIISNDKTFIYKKNDPFFKKDVIYYINYAFGNITIYYDAITHMLIGYKERNKDYQYPKIPNRYMKINYSITNMLKYLGYTSKYTFIGDNVKEMKKYYNDNQKILRSIVSNINRPRIDNLKQSITNVQRYIQRIKYNYQEQDVEKIVNKYKSKLKHMNIRDNSDHLGKRKVFGNWAIIQNNIFMQSLVDKVINIDVNNKYLMTDDVKEYNYHGNVILFYYINELNKLIKANGDISIKKAIVFFVIESIIKEHDDFNHENIENVFEIKKYNQLLMSKEYIYDVTERGAIQQDEDKELLDETVLDQLYSDKESLDAIDMEGGLDYEIDYVPGVNMS